MRVRFVVLNLNWHMLYYYQETVVTILKFSSHVETFPRMPALPYPCGWCFLLCSLCYKTKRNLSIQEVLQPKLSLELSHCSSVILNIIFLFWRFPVSHHLSVCPFKHFLQNAGFFSFLCMYNPMFFPKIKNQNIYVKFTTIINNAHQLYYILLSCLYRKTL